MKATKVKVDSKILNELRGAQFTPGEKVYAQEEVLVTIPSGEYETEVKNIESGGKRFDLSVAKFQVGKEAFEFAYRSGEVIDEDNDLVVARFVAERDFEASNGKRIPKGTKKLFCVNA